MYVDNYQRICCIKINMNKYMIAPDDCLILVALQQSSTLRGAAEWLHCDAGGLLRKIQRIAKEHGLLAKTDGKWKLTQEGQAVAAWTQESILSQQEVLRSSIHLRIASTAWFAEQVLIPASHDLQKLFGGRAQIQYLTPDQGLEKSLLSGECDFVVACHAPENPSIAHKQLQPELWSLVMAPSRLKRSSRSLTVEDLREIPLVRHRELNPAVFLSEELGYDPVVSLTFDNLIGVRSAVINGLGWSLVPKALVSDDLKLRRLIEVPVKIQMDRKVCVWWPRNSHSERKQHAAIYKWVSEAYSLI